MNKEILRLAIPAIASNITIPLLGLCDTAISGHLGSAAYIGAVSVGSMMLNVIYWLFGFLRMGTTGLTANAYGEGNMSRSAAILRKSVLMAVVVGVAAIMLQTPLLAVLGLLVGGTPDVMGPVASYFGICVWGVPAQLLVMAATGWFIGMQNTVVPMAVSIGMNVVNIAASVLLSVVAGMGFEGIAFGTLAASWAGAAAAGACVMARLGKFKGLDDGRAGKITWRRMFGVNGALFVRSACITAVSMTVTAIGARSGTVILAANAVMMQFFMFFSYFMDGFAFSGEALAGRYCGARDEAGLRSAVCHLAGWGAGMAVVFTICYAAGSDAITALLTDRPEVIEAVAHYRIFVILLPAITVAAFIGDGVFVGLTRTSEMMWATIGGTLCFFIPLALAGPHVANALLWTAFESYLLVRGVALTALTPRALKIMGRKRRMS